MYKYLLLSLFLLFPSYSFAFTTYTLPAPFESTVVDFPVVGSGITATPNGVFLYKIPAGTSWDRIQISVPDAYTDYAKTLGMSRFRNNGNTWFYNDYNGTSWNTGNTYLGEIYFNNDSNPIPGTLEFIATYGSTTVTTDEFYYFYLDPNSPYVDFEYNGTLYNYGRSANPNNYVVSTFVPTVKFCLGDCDDDSFPTDVVYFSNTHLTNFTGVNSLAYSTSTQTFSFNVTQFIETSELIPSQADRNITQHYVTYNYSSNTSQFTSQGLSFTPTQGNSTSSLSVTDTLFGADGTYTFKIEFGNLGTGITGIVPFADTYLYFTFTLSGGVVTAFSADPAYTSQNFVPGTTPWSACGLTDIGGCFINAMRFLFVPSQDSLQSVVGLVSSSSIPFVASAYESYSIFQDSLQTTQTATSSAFSYRLQIPEAGIDVVMLSPALITGNLGASAPIFRGIALVVLVFGFLYMITSSIKNKISVSGQGEYNPREPGSGGNLKYK